MKVLVTGRAGQLARGLAERAAFHPALEIVFAARPELDLADERSIRGVIRTIAPDVVVNAAAYTAVDAAEADEAGARLINADAPAVLAAELARSSGRLIQLSTDYVFDGTAAGAYHEDAAVAPINAYGRSKWRGEEAVRAALPEHVIVRTAWVYSPWGRNFVRTMLALAETRDTVRVVGDQIGTPTSAIDLAEGLLVAIERWPEALERRTYHLAGTGEASWAELATEVFAISRRHGGPTATVAAIASAEYPTPAARPRNSRLDSTRFAHTFGYTAPDWRRSLDDVVTRLLVS